MILLGDISGVGMAVSCQLSLPCVICPWSEDPSSPKTCHLEVVVNVSVTNSFTNRVVSPMPTPFASGRGWPCLSGLYPLTCPAWVSLPAAEAPTGIALRVLKAHMPPPPPS